MFQKLMPARQEAQAHEHKPDDMKILCDFDAMVENKVGFKFLGKFHELKNLTVKNYMEVTLAYSQFLDMINKRSSGVSLTADETYQKYYDLIHPLCPTITFLELTEMPFVQLNKLMELILRLVGGDPALFESSVEKKNPLNLIKQLK